MSLNSEERDAIVFYRTEKAKGIVPLQFWNAIANRLYYACDYYMSSCFIGTQRFFGSGTFRRYPIAGLEFRNQRNYP
jgi:hypothetical protein